MEPIPLPSNQPRGRFYQGGELISRFRNEQPSPPNTPEDWVASTTCVRGHPPLGMTRLATGQLLADAIASDPVAWLGERHVKRFGDDTMLLVKLLDAGQRLPIHAHPDGVFARDHVSANHGKAEAWYILSSGVVHLALTRNVPLEELHSLVASQDAAAILGLMHEIPVEADDCVFVPHGVLHSIGEGILLAEVQEPEDLSILLEWKDFDLDGENEGHLGLGFDLALTAIENRGRSVEEVGALVKRAAPGSEALPAGTQEFFRLERVRGVSDFPAGFAIVIALDSTTLTTSAGSSQALTAGSTTLVPFSAGSIMIDGVALVARPPLP